MDFLNKKNKRGQLVLDLIIAIIFLLAFALTIIFGFYILSDINSDVQADPDIATIAKDDLQGFTTNYPNFMDNAFVLFLALLWVALIVTSFMLDTHPIFFIITVVLLVFVFVVGMIMANTYQDIAGDEDITSYAASFPQMNWVFDNFLFIIIAIGMSSSLALYAKARI